MRARAVVAEAPEHSQASTVPRRWTTTPNTTAHQPVHRHTEASSAVASTTYTIYDQSNCSANYSLPSSHEQPLTACEPLRACVRQSPQSHHQHHPFFHVQGGVRAHRSGALIRPPWLHPRPVTLCTRPDKVHKGSPQWRTDKTAAVTPPCHSLYSVRQGAQRLTAVAH
ncbi:unnamed protein product [Mesocestoides corti]|uniref:Uncharacterized protein n=1 Tax=Mesocestoides corti TaxID=53468 RepID=A0A0R3UBQ1_MESCO|nr:unnamed protein product [Mesocestoides corti]